jgi:hypothetical protein
MIGVSARGAIRMLSLLDMKKPRSWHGLLWTFSFFFAINYVSSSLVLYITGNVLYSIVLLICYILMAKYRNEYTSPSSKGHSTQESLVEELKNIDIHKRSFVIERFLQMDRKRGERCGNICESERCVVCLDERAEIVTLPCSHKVICGVCAWVTFRTALQSSAVHTCVVCRSQIKDFRGSLFKNLVKLTWQDIRTILDETKTMQTKNKL